MSKTYRLREIAKFLNAELRGDPEQLISSIAPLDKATNQQICFLEKAEYRQHLTTTNAAAVILNVKDAANYSGNALIVANPYLSYAKLTSLFVQLSNYKAGIDSRTRIGENCVIDPTACIVNCTIGDNVIVGPKAIIESGCVIADDVVIGEDSHLYPNVTIYHTVRIGRRVIVHSGSIIGADGFGWANDKGAWCKIHQLGGVNIGDDVEIGANTCIDRGALEDTIIENGVKLDNLIQVAHNVKIGANTAIAGCTAIAGGTTIGKYCMIGGGVSFNGHIHICDQVIITGGSTVGRSIEQKGVYSSAVTVQPHRDWMKTLSCIMKLSYFSKYLKKIEETI